MRGTEPVAVLSVSAWKDANEDMLVEKLLALLM
jgi:hypothetical protein